MGRNTHTILHICLTCQIAGEAPDADSDSTIEANSGSDEETDGARLLAAVKRAIDAADAPLPIIVNPVTCMANCEQGCTAALSTPGKWSYIVGRLSDAEAEALVDYATIYAASRSGVIMPSKRSPALRDVVIARLPAHPDDIATNEDIQ